MSRFQGLHQFVVLLLSPFNGIQFGKSTQGVQSLRQRQHEGPLESILKASPVLEPGPKPVHCPSCMPPTSVMGHRSHAFKAVIADAVGMCSCPRFLACEQAHYNLQVIQCVKLQVSPADVQHAPQPHDVLFACCSAPPQCQPHAAHSEPAPDSAVAFHHWVPQASLQPD